MLFLDTISPPFGTSYEIFASTFSFYTWLWASTSTTTASKGLPLFYIIARLWQTSSTRFEPDHLRHEQARTARGGAHQPSMYERTRSTTSQDLQPLHKCTRPYDCSSGSRSPVASWRARTAGYYMQVPVLQVASSTAVVVVPVALPVDLVFVTIRNCSRSRDRAIVCESA